MATTKNYYDVLGVAKTASKDDIKKAFRKMAQKYHPDKGGGDEAKFKEVTEAYSILSDDRKRREYDAYGQSFPGGTQGNAGAQGFGGFDFSQFQQGFNGAEFDMGDIFNGFGDIFGQRSTQAARGRDIAVDIEVSFKESIFGTERTILIAKVSTCDVCTGTGAKPGTDLEQCKTCAGSGRVHETRRSILGSFTSARICPTCAGSGKIPKVPCTNCKGHGVLRKEEEIRVKVPGGIDSGEMIRMPGKGEATKAGTAGDLYIKVHVKPHELYRKEGSNLIMDLPVKITDALLGATITIETLEGKNLEVKVPAMKKAEEVLRVRGQGVPIERTRGDLLIRVHVALPQKISGKAHKALEDLRGEGI